MLSFSVLSFVAQIYISAKILLFFTLLYEVFIISTRTTSTLKNCLREHFTSSAKKWNQNRCKMFAGFKKGETDLYSYFFSGQRDDFFSLCYFKSLKSFTWTKWVPIFTQKKARTLLFSLYSRESLFLKLFVQTYTSTLFSITVTHACF